MTALPISMLLFVTAALQPAQAEIMQGQHVVAMGLGKGYTTTQLNSLQHEDLDGDGVNENLIQLQDIGRAGLSGFLQYNYFLFPFLGLGIELNATDFPKKELDRIDLNNAPTSQGQFSPFTRGKTAVNTNLMEYLATVKYVLVPTKRFNPYLLAGVGLNTFQAHSDIVPAIDGPGPALRANSWNRSSLGPAFALGGGVQTIIWRDDIMLGAEGRWSQALIDSAKFGTSSVSYSAFYFWLGYKWTAPL